MRNAKVLLKDRITISQRKLKDGRISLFYTYRVNGQKRREWPDTPLYLIPEKTSNDRIRNQETMRLAKAFRNKKQLNLQYMEAGIEPAQKIEMTCFRDYYPTIVAQKQSARTRYNYLSSMRRFDRFRPNILLSEINRTVYSEFVSYLKNDARLIGSTDKPLSANTIALNCEHLKYLLRCAQKDGKLAKLPDFSDIDTKWEDSNRQFLSMDEIRKLQSTPWSNNALKDSFLFACFTGLRYSDICALTPRKIVDGRIILRQQKTNDLVTIKLSDNAKQFLPANSNPDKPYFKIPRNNEANRQIRGWCTAAGIEKHITYHSSRHTYAMLILQATGNVYTTQRLMGHRCLGTTETYLHYLDETGDRAIDAIPAL